MAEFVMSRHAIERALDMGVAGEDISSAYHRPRSVSRAGPNREYRSHGKVTVVVALDVAPPVVTTVLWATAAKWVEDVESVAPSRRGPNEYGMRGVRNARRSNKKGRGKT